MPPLPGPLDEFVLNSPPGKHVDVPRVHAYRHGDFEDSLGRDNSLNQAIVETEEVAGLFNQ